MIQLTNRESFVVDRVERRLITGWGSSATSRRRRSSVPEKSVSPLSCIASCRGLVCTASASAPLPFDRSTEERRAKRSERELAELGG